MTKEFHHVTVLLHETVDMLDIKPNGIYVDATLGGSGHSAYLLSKLSEQGHLYCFDQDQKAIDNAQLIFTIFEKNLNQIIEWISVNHIVGS